MTSRLSHCLGCTKAYNTSYTLLHILNCIHYLYPNMATVVTDIYLYMYPFIRLIVAVAVVVVVVVVIVEAAVVAVVRVEVVLAAAATEFTRRRSQQR